MAIRAENLEPEMTEEDVLNLSEVLGIKRDPAMVIEVSQADAPPKGYDDTVRWPVWKTTLLVISLCGGFWICAAALMLAILG